MAFLQLGATIVEVTEFRRLPDERGGGGLRRTINGHLRGLSDWVKRGWSAEVVAWDDAERDAILAAADPDAEVAVSGDAVPAVTARVEVSGDIRYVRERDSWSYRIPLTVREV